MWRLYVFILLWCHSLFFFNCRLKDVQSIEELSDVYNHFLLYYGRDIPRMQNANKTTKKKLKKIKEVSEEDGTTMLWWNIAFLRIYGYQCDTDFWLY